MQQAEQIRIQAAEMQLAALENEYCNANWAFTARVKELREALAQRDKKQHHLSAQLAALKSSFAEHKADLGWAVSQLAKIETTDSPAKQSHNCTSNPSKSMRYSPKNETKRLFFRLDKQNCQQHPLSANITTISATSLRTRLIYDQPRVNPQIDRTNPAARYGNTQATMQSPPSLNQLRQTNIRANFPLRVLASSGKGSPRSAIVNKPNKARDSPDNV